MSRIEGAVEENQEKPKRNYIIFLSIPLGFLLGFFRFNEPYDIIGLLLFLLILCFVYDVFDKSVASQRDKPADRINDTLSQLGYIIIVAGALVANIPYISFIYIFGVLLTAVFAGLVRALAGVCVFASMMIMFSGAETSFMVVSFVTAILCVVLTRYMDDRESLLYIILTIAGIDVALYLIFNQFSLNGLFTREHLCDAIVIIGSVFASYALGKKFHVIGEEAVAEENHAESEPEPVEETAQEPEEGIAPEAEAVKEETVFTDPSEVVYELDAYDEADNEEPEEAEITVIPPEPESDTEVNSVDENIKEPEAKIEEQEEEKAEESEEPKEAIKPRPDYLSLISDDFELVKLVKENEKLYEESLIRSFLAESIADAIGAESDLAAAGAFYCEVGKLVSKNYIKEGILLARKYELPDRITDCIKEHNFKLGKPNSRETAIIMIVDKLTATVSFLEKSGAKATAVHIIDGVIDSCLMDGKLNDSGLSMSDLMEIKAKLIKEVPKTYAYFN